MLQSGSTRASPNLDILRSLATLMVVSCHLFIYFGNPVLFGLFEPGLLGILGVAIFFVHTSLVLMQSLARREPYLSDWALHLDFYIRRGFRIYPLSILIVTVVYFFKLPLAHLQPHQLSEGRYGLSVLFANLALVQNCLQNGEILGPLWSLPFEVQMYLVFPALYLMVRAGVGSSAAIFGWAIVCMISLEAARLLRDDSDIHFLLSGWGIGFDQLREMQSEAKLPNVTLVDRVEDHQLETFLSAADAWIIPYRKNVAGVSVPSRFYNLLAIGRPVILVSEAGAEAALTVTEHDVGWVVEPGRPDELAKAVRRAASADDPQRAARAAEIAGRFDFDAAMDGYCGLIRELSQPKPD
jgi:hypothetical protein